MWEEEMMGRGGDSGKARALAMAYGLAVENLH